MKAFAIRTICSFGISQKAERKEPHEKTCRATLHDHNTAGLKTDPDRRKKAVVECSLLTTKDGST